MQTPTSLKIRQAHLADLDAIDQLEQVGFTADRQSRRSLRYLLSQANALSLLAEDAAGPCGYVTLLFRRNSDIVRLYSIAVHPRSRRASAGRRLVREAEDAARRRGNDRMRLEVRLGNTSSRGLFAAQGYVEVKTLPGYYPDGEDGLRLERDLSGDR